MRCKFYSVVLFDEVEKAHPDVFNTLLQLLDDGRLTDSQGRTVDFKNTIVIMTSNLGSQLLLEGISSQGIMEEGVRESVLSLLRTQFRPEFLNRVDEVVLFKPLLPEQIKQIIELLLESLRGRLAERKITLELSDAAKDFIAREAYDPVYGARPLLRYLQRNLETPLAKAIIAEKITDGQMVKIDCQDGKLLVDADKSHNI